MLRLIAVVPVRLAWLLAPLLIAGCTPAPEAAPRAASGPAVAASTTTAAAPGETVQLVSLRVPSMHCQHGCWPKVQRTLEQQDGVLEVTLGDQTDSEFDPVVHVQTGEGFDSAGAVNALASAGFGDAAVEAPRY
jgi:hypothetical protein